MTELLPNLFCGEVPQNATNFEILFFSKPQTLFYDYWIECDGQMAKGLIAMTDLPPGNWRYICKYPDCTEEQAAEIKEILPKEIRTNEPVYYRFHCGEESIATTDWRKSLASLLRGKGLDTSKHYVILKKEV